MTCSLTITHVFLLQCVAQMALMRSACAQLRECEPFLKLLQAVLELGNHLNAGTQRGAAAGFKLDTLLKLSDVKAVDRKTSLLQFVVTQLMAQDPSIADMAAKMDSVRPAATMQLSAVSAMVGELRVGLKLVQREAASARAAAERGADAVQPGADGQGSVECEDELLAAAVRFADAMERFHESAAAEFASNVEAAEKATLADLHSTTEYFGEGFVPADPTRVVRIVRDFVILFERALAEIAAKEAKEAEVAKKAAAKGVQRAPVAPAPCPALDLEGELAKGVGGMEARIPGKAADLTPQSSTSCIEENVVQSTVEAGPALPQTPQVAASSEDGGHSDSEGEAVIEAEASTPSVASKDSADEFSTPLSMGGDAQDLGSATKCQLAAGRTVHVDVECWAE